MPKRQSMGTLRPSRKHRHKCKAHFGPAWKRTGSWRYWQGSQPRGGGFAFFEERLGLINVAGMTLIIVSIILMNLTIRIEYKKKYGKYLPRTQRSAEPDDGRE